MSKPTIQELADQILALCDERGANVTPEDAGDAIALALVAICADRETLDITIDDMWEVAKPLGKAGRAT